MSENTETKWRAENLGLRQAKQFNDALSAFGWEAKTTGEITDYSDGKPHYSVVMFGGSWSPLARELMDAIKAKYSLLVTGDNYKAIVADLQAATARHAKEGRPVVDRRSTPEERAERDQARQEREAKEAAKAAHLATLQHHTYDLPETAKAVKRVLGVIFPDTAFSVTSKSYSGGSHVAASWTDGPTENQIKPVLDVFQTTTFDGMDDSTHHIGPREWNGHLFEFHAGYTQCGRSNSIALLRQCAERFAAETRLPAPTIKEENGYTSVERDWGSKPCGFSFHFGIQVEEYPNGCISHDDHSNHTAADIVGQIAHHTATEQPAYPLADTRLEGGYESIRELVYRILLGELGKPPEPESTVLRAHLHAAGGITVSENTAKGGIEIRFPDKPERATLDSLKAHGWRWSRFSSCWYAKKSPAALEFANRIAGKVADTGDEGLAAMTDVDSQYERQCEDATMP